MLVPFARTPAWPIGLRMLAEHGFTTVGLDQSATAIELARAEAAVLREVLAHADELPVG